MASRSTTWVSRSTLWATASSRTAGICSDNGAMRRASSSFLAALAQAPNSFSPRGRVGHASNIIAAGVYEMPDGVSLRQHPSLGVYGVDDGCLGISVGGAFACGQTVWLSPGRGLRFSAGGSSRMCR